MTKMTTETKLSLQFLLGCLVVIAGLTLLFLGFFAVPVGEITPSVLTAFGEAATFSGALIGVDYNYKFRMFKTTEEYRHRRKIRGINEETEEVENDTEELD